MRPLERLTIVSCGLVVVAALALPSSARAQGAGELSRFEHEAHVDFPCAECHSSGTATTVSNRTWCADCHHTKVGFEQCQRCHEAEDIAPEPLRRLVTFRLPGEVERNRSLTFDHGTHGGVSCSSCHTGDAALRTQAQCSSCHTDHHKAGSDCLACHSEPPVEAHAEDVHVDLAGCGTAGCHEAAGVDYGAMLDERNFCVSCHVGQRDHERPGACVTCHLLDDSEAMRR
jgi:hypothetical protein